jgi:hypothetical protein
VAPKKVLDWLLAEEQPGVRYRTLTEILHRPRDDPEVRAALAAIPKRGWAADLLARRNPGGWWAGEESLFTPKYSSTMWRMLELSDLGLTREDPRIAASCEMWMRRTAAKGGGVGGNSKGNPHHCYAGNMARALIRFGYVDDDRIRHTMDWLAESADPKGGWNCFERGRNLDSWEGMSAFAVYPRAKWTPAMTRAVELGAEYYLEHRLHRLGERYPPWYRFHYPIHYYYDLLVGLDFLTRLGYGDDPRLGYALRLLRSKRRADGRWNLDAVHPDVAGYMLRYFRAHPDVVADRAALETAGRPSKMVTLTALGVLDRLGAGR